MATAIQDLTARDLRAKSWFWLGVILTLFAARGLPFTGYIPIWDGWQYADCVLQAVAAGQPQALNCFDHIVIGYTMLLAGAHAMLGGGYGTLLLTNLAVGGVALCAFYTALGVLFPDPGRRVDRLMLTAVLSANPLLMASTINPNPDYGVFAFSCVCLATILTGRRVATVVAGIALVLSKETGVVFYGLLIGWSVVFHDLLVAGTIAERARRLLRDGFLAAPPILFLTLFVWRTIAGSTWQPAPMGAVHPERIPVSYLAGAFVLQFAWVPLLFLAAGLLWWLRSAKPIAEYRALSGSHRDRALVVATLVSATALVVLYPTFTNPRYLLPLIPFFLIASYAALDSLVRVAGVRRAILASWLLLFLGSNVMTLDPVSRLIYGTFSFGEHQMLKMTSLTGECCGAGRDQLAYNLEFTAFHYLLDDIFSDLHPVVNAPLLAPTLADWQLAAALDGRTSRRTLSRSGTFGVELMGTRELVAMPSKPPRAYFLALPNFSLDPVLWDYYDSVQSKTYERLGYAIVVHELELRTARQVCQAQAAGQRLTRGSSRRAASTMGPIGSPRVDGCSTPA